MVGRQPRSYPETEFEDASFSDSPTSSAPAHEADALARQGAWASIHDPFLRRSLEALQNLLPQAPKRDGNFRDFSCIETRSVGTEPTTTTAASAPE